MMEFVGKHVKYKRGGSQKWYVLSYDEATGKCLLGGRTNLGRIQRRKVAPEDIVLWES